LDAARRELAGEIVKLKASGKAFDHIDEVRSAQRGLLNRIDTLKSELANPNLSTAERALLQGELGVASRVLDYSERYLSR
jgi:hypothetical protein